MYEEDLQKLFVGEVQERTARLVAGAEALASGPLSPDDLQTMVREGHTIKGTARMMGFVAISDAGKALEDAWRAITADEVAVNEEVVSALVLLAGQMVGAVRADPATGTPGLASGMRALRRALRQDEPPPEDPRPMRPQGDLDGLLGAIDSWAFGETVRVNAASLFRLINEICSLRVDSEDIAEAIGRLAREDADPRALGPALENLASRVHSADKSLLDLQDRAVQLASAPLSDVTATFPQLVRYVSRRAGKEVRFEMLGGHIDVDRQVLERLTDALRHLLVNAIQHGIERPEQRQASGKPQTATLVLRAEVCDGRLEIVVEDDGRGVDWSAVRRAALRRGLLAPENASDPEALREVLFAPKFSTSTPSELNGDGQGLATVAEVAEILHGTVVLDTRPGEGTRVTLTVPTSKALQDAVLVVSAGQTWGIPAIAVLDRVPLATAALWTTEGRQEMTWEGSEIPVISLAQAVGLVDTAAATRVLVVSTAVGPTGLMVERELGRRQVASRELGPVLDGVPYLTGAAVLGGGDVVVLVDPGRLASQARVRSDSGPRRRVLIIDDSRGARQIVGGALGSAGFEVDLAASPTEALSVLAEQQFDAIVMDYVMPTMDGATLAARVRQLGVSAPIVMLSGAATAEDQRRAIAAGANAYLNKDDLRQGALANAITELIEAA